jgi:hypothetical protein
VQDLKYTCSFLCNDIIYHKLKLCLDEKDLVYSCQNEGSILSYDILYSWLTQIDTIK